MVTHDRQLAAAALLERRELRRDLVKWAEFIGKEKGWVPAKHHRLLLEKLQQLTDGTLKNETTGKVCKNLIILMPPGSAKSSYTSVVFPVWFMQRWIANGNINPRILSCSYSGELIESFSRECRNIVAAHHVPLGYDLEKDSRAVQEWSTTNGGTYRCAGVGAGIAGRRFDFGIIDDYLGTQEDADSKVVRDKQWMWYLGDFFPRRKPEGVQVIVANRRHEEDVVGRLLDPENKYGSPVDPTDWVVISIPFFAEQDDVLGRAVGERLWPEWFTEEQAKGIRRLPSRIFAGLYQQRPAPEEGDFFKKDWLVPYTQGELDQLMKQEPKIYGAGDWAVSERKGSNKTCLGGAALGQDGKIYILPDIFWQVAGPKEVTQALLDFMKRRNPLVFRSEKGHISQAWGPFFNDMMRQSEIYNYIEEVTPARDKETRAQSFRGFCSMGMVRFPTWCSWWNDAAHELLTFPGGKSDDFVDFCAHLGGLIQSMVKPQGRRHSPLENINVRWKPTVGWLKSVSSRKEGNLRYHDR